MFFKLCFFMASMSAKQFARVVSDGTAFLLRCLQGLDVNLIILAERIVQLRLIILGRPEMIIFVVPGLSQANGPKLILPWYARSAA